VFAVPPSVQTHWRDEEEIHVQSNGGSAEQQTDAGSTRRHSFIVHTGKKDARPVHNSRCSNEPKGSARSLRPRD
jgi:hypothetical protein